MNESHAITVAIADNDAITAKALAALLELNDDFQVIWTALSGRQTIVNCLEDERWPEVMLIDAELGDSLGTEICRRLRADNGTCAILVVTAYPVERYRHDAALAGAQGIVGKADYPWLERAIRLVHEGRTFVMPSGPASVRRASTGEPPFESTAEAHRRLHSQPSTPVSQLSFQESQVLSMSAQGLTQGEIAAELDITPSSVRTHSLRARRKLGASTLTQAVVQWLRHAV